MTLFIFAMLRYSLVLVFGVMVSLLLANVRHTAKSTVVTICFCAVALAIQLLCWKVAGMKAASHLYPLIVHLPLLLLLIFYFKRPWTISLSSVVSAYLCCQIPRWVGSVTATIFTSRLSDHIAYIIAMFAVYYLLKRFVADHVHRLMERSARSCILFGAVPFLYYAFDYATTVYTESLYLGTRAAVQFAPSLICTFYFIFVLLYCIESQKQANAQRDLAVFDIQLNQARTELNTLRQMHKQTVIYRHDMRHHLSFIAGLAADGKMDRIKAYLSEVQKSIDEITPKRFCENETVNLILSSFDVRARQEGVQLAVEINLPKELPLPDTELCAILSNALENAISAVKGMDDSAEKKVLLDFTVYQGKLLMEIRNPFMGEISFENGLPPSGRSGHGFGLKSIDAIVSKHHGMFSVKAEEGEFVVRIVI